MKKILVIGYGNTLRGDDGAGFHAAELIAKQHPQIKCIFKHQLAPELSEEIAECDIVFFIDADINAKEPSVRLISSSVETEQPRTHFTSPESLLNLSQQLYQRIPSKAYVVGIPAAQFEFTEELSGITTTAISKAVDIVEKLTID